MMNSKECEEQLKFLIEAWDCNEAILNQTDINAIEHLLLENTIQHDKINALYGLLSKDKQKIDYWAGIVENLEKWLDEVSLVTKESIIEKVKELKGEKNEED